MSSLESLGNPALDLADVNPPEPQTLLPHAPEQFEVHPIALLGLAVQAGDEVESRQQLRKPPLTTLPAMLVDQPDCGPELLGVAVQPVLLVHSGIGGLQTERALHRQTGSRPMSW